MKLKSSAYILYSTVAAVMSFSMAACMEGDWDTPDMTTPPYGNNAIVETDSQLVTIDSLKQRYKSAISTSSMEKIEDHMQLKAVITGNDLGSNIYKQICIQDSTGAMIVGINGTGLFPMLPVGQEILIDLKDLYIGGYGQQAQLGDEYNGSIGRMSTDKWEQHVRILPNFNTSAIDTIDFDVNLDKDRYAGYLVCLTNVQVGDADGKTTFAPEYKSGTTLTYNGSSNGYVHHTLGTASMNQLVLRTSTYAKFAELVIPTHPITIYGIATRYRDTWQILIRTEEDIKDNE
ncbi:MAG: DUF5689 domain-containing protein [Bacteroidaceae bacterium]|nr:DUF5689 domain-containing protein [Bacteroidaceae bacterium]